MENEIYVYVVFVPLYFRIINSLSFSHSFSLSLSVGNKVGGGGNFGVVRSALIQSATNDKQQAARVDAAVAAAAAEANLGDVPWRGGAQRGLGVNARNALEICK